MSEPVKDLEEPAWSGEGPEPAWWAEYISTWRELKQTVLVIEEVIAEQKTARPPSRWRKLLGLIMNSKHEHEPSRGDA